MKRRSINQHVRLGATEAIQLTAFDIALVSLIAGAVAVLLLLLGFLVGVKRRKIKTHHLGVYSTVVIQLLVAIFWMIPRSLYFISMGLLSDPVGSWHTIVHIVVGFLALGLGLVISLIFLLKPGMPPKLVKSTRPLMKITLVLWLTAFILGIVSFVVGYFT